MDCSVLVMSCDSYDDIWKPFFHLKNKYWEDCPYQTYVVTETKDCEYAKTIKATGEWTKRLRQALQQLDTKYVLLLLDDFFIQTKVNQKEIEKAFKLFDDNTACINFEVQYKNKDNIEQYRLRENKEPYLNSCQPSLHDREKLIERLQENQTAWEWETTIVDSQYKFYINTKELVFDIGYYENREAWAIVRGKISNNMVDLFQKENLELPKNREMLDKDKKILSIITPYFNTLQYTKKLAEVLQPQLNELVEWIIIDDGCDEKELDKLNATVQHVKNGGVSKARNIGLNTAKGEYIAFIDSDDLVTNDYIEKILNKIFTEKFDYCFISWASYLNDKKVEDIIITNNPPQFNTCVWNCIYNKKSIKNARFPENLQIGEEIEFNKQARIGKKSNIVDVLYIYNRGRENSLTAQFSKGIIKADRAVEKEQEEKIKAQFIIYRSFLSVIGGIETAIYNACNNLKDIYDIVFVYEYADIDQLLRLNKIVKCVKFNKQEFECDTLLLYGFNPSSILEYIKADKIIQQICCNIKEVGFVYIRNNRITHYTADSQASANQFMETYPDLKCEVLHNFIDISNKRCLYLMSATRLSWEKGYPRMVEMAKIMNNKKIPFVWTIFTNETPKENIDGFVFMKPRLNVTDYMKNQDYGVQVSYSESWGNTVNEFLKIGVPVIASEWASVREQIEDGVNGFIINKESTNIEEIVDKMYNSNLKGFKYKDKNIVEDWKNIIGDLGKKKGVYIPDNLGFDAIVLKSCYYSDEDVNASVGDLITILTKERYDKLIDLGYIRGV